MPKMPGGRDNPAARFAGSGRPANPFKTMSRLLKYYGKCRWMFTVAVIMIAVYSLATIAASYMMKPLVAVLEEASITPDAAQAKYLALLIGMAGLYVLSVLTNYCLNYLMLKCSATVLCDLRKDMFDKMQSLPISYFDTHTHGELMSYYTNDIDAIRELLHQSITQLIISCISLVGIVAMMLILSVSLFAIVVVMGFVVFFTVKFIGKKSGKNFARQQKAVASVNGYIEEMMAGQKVVKAFNHEEESMKAFDVLNIEFCSAATKANTYANIMGPIMNNLSHVTYAIIAASGGLLGVAGIIDIGTLGAFLQYTRSFSMPVAEISQQANNVLSALAGAERIFALLDEKAEEDEGDIVMVNARVNEKGELEECSERTEIWAWKKPTGELIRVRGDVRFEDVTFSYDGKVDVLKNVSLYAKPGQKIAFVGSTGAGKTTITNLINRFYDIQSGRITYDGIPIRQIKKASLRGSLGMVLQDTHLFTGTVRENIRYGRLDATDEEIVSAAKLANAHYFISHLPEGYDTVLTADGANLSQGQRQLIAIARAAVADPPVLILDEATSSIDTRTESLIEKGMDSLMKDRTVFVIAHRLSTVRNSDAIMVLEHGEIIERGNHDELIKQQGKYYQLYMGMFELS
jgi:ATP-binding cassette subfamily B multidrug efflux pump